MHRETKDAAVYALAPGKGPSKLKEVKGDCPEGHSTCGDFTRITGRGFLIGPMVSMANVAEVLSFYILDRPVLDETGIKGYFNVDLHWTPDRFRGQEAAAGDGREGDGREGVTDPNGPSLSTAVQEQLGLKMEARKGRVEMLVIDGAERPSGN